MQVGQLSARWRRPDTYTSLTDYITARGLQAAARFAMASCTIAYSAITFGILASSARPHTGLGCLVSGLTSTLTLAVGVAWLLRWPARNESRIIVAVLCAAITVQILGQSDPWLALLGTTVFAILAGYVATLHGARMLAAVVAVALIMVVVASFRMPTGTDPAVIVAAASGIALNIVALPCVLVVAVPALHLDARNADVDPLTGLLNRRGLELALNNWVDDSHNAAGLDLWVMVFDLDGFKSVNDTSGHSAGDELLRHVAATLLGAGDGDLVRGRVGGEEFVVVGSGSPEWARTLSDFLRVGIADNQWRTTASVGVASMHLPAGDVITRRASIVELFDAADREMYRAKRAGGDRVCATSLPTDAQVAEPPVGEPPI